MVNKCQQQVRPVQLHFRTLTWFVTKSESQPFIWRPFFVQRHSTAQSNCCTKWKSGARGAQALAEIPQEPQPPWRLWVWPVSLHSFGALFLLCGTQPHNPTAALNERAAPGELRLSRKFRKSRSPPGACEFGQCRSIHSAPLRHSTAQSNWCSTKWKSGQGSSGSRGNSARAAACRSPPGACEFGLCRSIHSAPCFCFAALNRTIQLLLH